MRDGNNSSLTAFLEQPHVSESLSTTDFLTQAEPLLKKPGYVQNILPSILDLDVTVADKDDKFELQ